MGGLDLLFLTTAETFPARADRRDPPAAGVAGRTAHAVFSGACLELIGRGVGRVRAGAAGRGPGAVHHHGRDGGDGVPDEDDAAAQHRPHRLCDQGAGRVPGADCLDACDRLRDERDVSQTGGNGPCNGPSCSAGNPIPNWCRSGPDGGWGPGTTRRPGGSSGAGAHDGQTPSRANWGDHRHRRARCCCWCPGVGLVGGLAELLRHLWTAHCPGALDAGGRPGAGHVVDGQAGGVGAGGAVPGRDVPHRVPGPVHSGRFGADAQPAEATKTLETQPGGGRQTRIVGQHASSRPRSIWSR